MALAMLSDGCAGAMREALPSLLQSLVPMLGDDHPRVRHAALKALCHLCDVFGPSEVGEANFQQIAHKELLPVLVCAYCPYVLFILPHAGVLVCVRSCRMSGCSREHASMLSSWLLLMHLQHHRHAHMPVRSPTPLKPSYSSRGSCLPSVAGH